MLKMDNICSISPCNDTCNVQYMNICAYNLCTKTIFKKETEWDQECVRRSNLGMEYIHTAR